MSTINDTDLILVNRAGSSYKTPFSSFTTPIAPPNWEWSDVNNNSDFIGIASSWSYIFNTDTGTNPVSITGVDKSQAYGVTFTATTPFYADELSISWINADQGGSLPPAYMYINGDSSTKHYATANTVIDTYTVNSTITTITLEAGPGLDNLGSYGILADGVWLVTGEPAGAGYYTVEDTDTLLVNRAGVSYQCSWGDAKGTTSYYEDGTSFSGTLLADGNQSIPNVIAQMYDGSLNEDHCFCITGTAASPSTITFTNLPTYQTSLEVWVYSNQNARATFYNENGASSGVSSNLSGGWNNVSTGAFANTKITSLELVGQGPQTGMMKIAGIKMDGVEILDGSATGSSIQDADLLLINRAGASYKVTGADFQAGRTAMLT